jgi:hypothetical protein
MKLSVSYGEVFGHKAPWPIDLNAYSWNWAVDEDTGICYQLFIEDRDWRRGGIEELVLESLPD